MNRLTTAALIYALIIFERFWGYFFGAVFEFRWLFLKLFDFFLKSVAMKLFFQSKSFLHVVVSHEQKFRSDDVVFLHFLRNDPSRKHHPRVGNPVWNLLHRPLVRVIQTCYKIQRIARKTSIKSDLNELQNSFSAAFVSFSALASALPPPQQSIHAT